MHLLSDLLVISDERRCVFQRVEPGAWLSGAGKPGGQVSGGDKQEAQVWGAGATGNEEAEIHQASAPEVMAEDCSRANRWN